MFSFPKGSGNGQTGCIRSCNVHCSSGNCQLTTDVQHVGTLDVSQVLWEGGMEFTDLYLKHTNQASNQSYGCTQLAQPSSQVVGKQEDGRGLYWPVPAAVQGSGSFKEQQCGREHGATSHHHCTWMRSSVPQFSVPFNKSTLDYGSLTDTSEAINCPSGISISLLPDQSCVFLSQISCSHPYVSHPPHYACRGLISS